MAHTIFEKLEDYQNSIEKALAGYLTGKKMEDLTGDEIKRAKSLSEKLTNWNDYLELSFALDREDSAAVDKILKKIEESKNYLHFLPSKFFINEDISAHWIAEGFNYTLRCENTDVRDDLIEWLESNKIKFQLMDEYKICVECDDRETIYKIGKAVTRLNRKNHTVRDSMEEAKDKMKIEIPARKKPLNPMAGVLNNPLFYPKTEKSRAEKVQKRDQWNRKAKYKTKAYESIAVKSKNAKIMEMNDLPEIKRLKTLAGIRTESESPLAPGPVNTDIELPPVGSSIADMPVIKNAADDLAASMNTPVEQQPAPEKYMPANEPISVDPTPVTGPSAASDANPITSAQYTRALGLLNQALVLVSDLKMSEYKMFLNQVNSFVDSVKNIGRTLVAESRKQK